jgi:hypothetical protein
MKYKKIIIIYLCVFLTSRPDKNNTKYNKNIESVEHKKIQPRFYKKCPLNRQEINMHIENPICIAEGIVVNKSLLSFAALDVITVEKFMEEMIDAYCILKDDKKNELKGGISKLHPDHAWAFLTNPADFNSELITALNYLFCPESFALLYKTRITIEFLIFSFNTKEKKKSFTYQYANTLKLKEILQIIKNFVREYQEEIQENLTIDQIAAFEKFLDKYLGMNPKNINYMSFLKELSEFKNFIAVFSPVRGDTKELSVIEKMSIFNRFSSIVKI